MHFGDFYTRSVDDFREKELDRLIAMKLEAIP
jgi:hypothetical protein